MSETTVREFYTCHVYDAESNPVEGNDPLSCATLKDIIHNRVELCEKIFDEPCDTTDERLSRLVYKATACGGWCKTSDEGVTIGTIVEGTDAETQRLIPYPFSKSDWDNAWEDIERWAEDIWIEASKDE